jgi:hypothetical protein
MRFLLLIRQIDLIARIWADMGWLELSKFTLYGRSRTA